MPITVMIKGNVWPGAPGACLELYLPSTAASVPIYRLQPLVTRRVAQSFLRLACLHVDLCQAEVEQQHKHIKSMIQQLQHQEQLMIADVRAAKVSLSQGIHYHCKVDTHIHARLS